MDKSVLNFSAAKTLKHIAVYFLLFLAGDFFSTFAFDMLFHVVRFASGVNYFLRALGCLALTFCLFYLYTTKALHLKMSDFGINAAIKGWGVLFSLLLPGFVLAAFLLLGDVSANPVTPGKGVLTVVYSLMMALKAGILEEMLFRGFIMKLIEGRWNRYAAVLFPSFLFSLAHIPSMEYFSVGGILLLLVSGTLVGVMFSLMAYRGSSISNGALVHAAWNFVMVTDILHITTMDGAYGKPLFSIIIPSDNILLTGAGFGVEASVVAIIGYLAVACLMFVSRKTKLRSGILLLCAGTLLLSGCASSGEKPVKEPETDDAAYIGEYLDRDTDEPGLEIAKCEDGGYIVQISVYRLTSLSDGVGELSSDGMTFTATDAAGNPISGTITAADKAATVTITDSSWEGLPDGSSFRYEKASDTPNLWN